MSHAPADELSAGQDSGAVNGLIQTDAAIYYGMADSRIGVARLRRNGLQP